MGVSRGVPRVIALCRDHLDNILFEAEVKTVEDEKKVQEECKKYVDDTWVDYILKDDQSGTCEDICREECEGILGEIECFNDCLDECLEEEYEVDEGVA